MSNLNSLQYFIPELFLIVAILVIIVVDLFLKKNKKIVSAYLAALTLVVTIFLAYQQYGYSPALLFKGMIVLDSFAIFFKIITALSTLIVIFISLPSFRTKAEYYVLLLIVTLGMFLMVEVNNLLMIIISMEMVGLISYVLVGFNKHDLKSSEASLKFMLYGATSTAVMAFGFSYIYGISGHLNLDVIQQSLIINQPQALPLFVAFMMVLAGLGYKIAMVPFHFWVPDVYEGAPTPITAFLSVGPKAAGLALLIRFLITLVAHPSAGNAANFIQNVSIHAPLLLAALAVATMTLGNLSALMQKNIKRMLGYSAIAHVGYMLMALVVFNNQGIIAVMFYIVVYLFMNFGAFCVVESLTDKLGSEKISAYTGLGYRAPFTAIAMAIFMFSLTGLPPFAGFIGKLYLFAAVINQSWYILALIGLLNSVISLYYYATVVKVMFLNRQENAPPLRVALYNKLLIGALLIPTLVLGLYWSPVINFTSRSIGFLFGK
ncbi:NADH-quinone oxidoreductase subunit N [bacterium BMS3Abin05]|nr:NADH-quinone oxidoreductase subunit N [bacterium BMS3Abin05]GBE27211.1 NADH-quinone oxidoreductase subunit N [bacterium BMS3Bbin03]HDZ10628.1 NADH-quinone oxidoreductase subunit N [Bacteroidota bacterium]